MNGIGRRIAVWALAKSIAKGASVTELRAALDKSHAHRDEEWRREVWREAAERAAKVSR